MLCMYVCTIKVCFCVSVSVWGGGRVEIVILSGNYHEIC